MKRNQRAKIRYRSVARRFGFPACSDLVAWSDLERARASMLELSGGMTREQAEALARFLVERDFRAQHRRELAGAVG